MSGMSGTWGSGARCKIAEGWDGAGREGEALCYVQPSRQGAQTWIIVMWDDEDEPDLHKAAGLLIKRTGERTYKAWRT